MSRIGKNIKKARSEKGYTQEQLAQKLSVTRNTISNYETGHSNPDIEEKPVSGSGLQKRDFKKNCMACNCRIDHDGIFLSH